MTRSSPGSFAVTLDAAIDEAGLSLDRLQHHLAARGVHLSRSALSYWRRGRSQPEREKSLLAVTHLEAVLGLEPGALTGLLGPKAPRGRWLGEGACRIERRRLWPDLRVLAAELKPPPDGQLSFWSIHDHLVLDERGGEQALRVRMVAEAAVDGVDRLMTYYQADAVLPADPCYRYVRSARLGQVCVDRRTGMVAGELRLAHPLALGEVTVVDYEIRFPPGSPIDHYHRRFTRPIPEYVCQVHFGPRSPRGVRSFEQRGLGGPEHPGSSLATGATHTATMALRDARPGIYGISWHW
ncbi:XRE family transcriptional regulator [Amycolatopsis sp. OK19-0408]|uniref:XRE family transcriptional regulator n=1 Tax=Amycolatopsis iheyensis TaxID=2945988 RepID=A0A9X2SP49_9PSEU|nr:XRE family transcriptional regulator [Amycolatopsis iheyensis]MCR6487811.1 XRE family transcriptional regulator [Amycolatopsis iheyensis]